MEIEKCSETKYYTTKKIKIMQQESRKIQLNSIKEATEYPAIEQANKRVTKRK